MSSSLFLDPGVLAFIPASEVAHTTFQEPQIDRYEIESEIRAELEQDYQSRLDREIATCRAQERAHFDQALKQCAAGFDGCITTLRKEIQNNVVDLSIRLAEVIVRHELPDRSMLHNVIVKTLEPVSDLQGATVRISSHDWTLFGSQLGSGDQLGVGSTVKFAEDPNLSAGDVIVESRNGIFDARLEERLKLLKEALHERSGRKTEPSAEL
jgi:flagellar biosynthesis/type III secretory pathway protein FliH